MSIQITKNHSRKFSDERNEVVNFIDNFSPVFVNKKDYSLKYKVKYEACEVRKTRDFTLVNDRFPDKRNEVAKIIDNLLLVSVNKKD